MVHKKSEYRLNYKWNPSSLYQETWQSGFNYRVQRRLHDYSHLPLPWEVHGCKCDDDDEEYEAHLPLPKTRLKHNVLNEQWERTRQTEKFKEPIELFDAGERVRRDVNGTSEDWYRKWEEKEHQETPSPIPSAREKLKTPKFDISPQFKERDDIDDGFRDYGYETRQQSPVFLAKGTQTLPSLSRSARIPHAQMDLQVTEPGSKPTCMPKFLPYGWGSKRDVSDKKTFNVFAPTRHLNQFYPSAIRAWKRKEDDITKAIQQDIRCPQREVYRTAENVISFPASIWMTEYQKQYSTRKPMARPATAPPANLRQLGGFYHKCCL